MREERGRNNGKGVSGGDISISNLLREIFEMVSDILEAFASSL